MIGYNVSLLNPHDLVNSFFILDKDDPTQGFAFDATCYAGPTLPEHLSTGYDALTLRLKLGSHLASHIRNELENRMGYTSTVGISTSKLLSKLVGNMHKPKSQTTLIPPYVCVDEQVGNVEAFIDDYEIGKIPGIGSKLAQKLRQHVLQHEPDFEKGLIYGETKEKVTVKDFRLAPNMGAEAIEKLLSGPGSPHGIGIKTWLLLHGIDDTEVNFAKAVPSQISIEDSYIRLDTLPEVLKELKMLGCSLIERMRIDLVTEDDDDPDQSARSDKATDISAEVNGELAIQQENTKARPLGRWLAHPKTIRLSTRPRLPLNPDGTRSRSFKRISHSAPLPSFVFSLTDSVNSIAEKLVHETVIGMFRKLHPEKAGWNLSLVNVAVTNMAETGGESRTANGRDIGSMFKRQESVHKQFRVYDQEETEPSPEATLKVKSRGQQTITDEQSFAGYTAVDNENSGWVDEDGEEEAETCGICGMSLPPFAMSAHIRFHQMS